MKLKAKLKDIKIDYKTKHKILEFEILDNAEFELTDDILELEYKKYRNKRSLNANNYAWALITQISEAMNITKEEVYINYIKDINVYRDVEINKEATKTLIYTWNLNGIGWIAEKLDNSQREGFELIRLYYGSSTFNTKQMAKFIDNIVIDCKKLGIATLEDKELERLVNSIEK